MITQKIDKNLLNVVFAQGEQFESECIIEANDFQRLKNMLLKKGAKVLDEYLFIKSFRVKIKNNLIKSLAKTSQVKFISSVSRAQTLISVSRKILGVDEISLSGKGVGVAFIDTGISSHPDFLLGKNRIKFFKDFVNGKENNYDDNGHGTFVSGVCSGSGALSGGECAGIAPQSEIISLKALNGLGEASADKILNAMEWIFENHLKYNIRVVTMSFGSEPIGYSDPIMAGAEALWKEGIVVVSAAGNSGPEYQTIKSPGVSSKIITVGGFDDNRSSEQEYNENFFEIASFSSRGPAFSKFKPDLIAPAVDIKSCNFLGGYTSLSGTSVATPMIAGLCALLLEKAPQATPNDVKRALMLSAKKICFNRNFEGAGIPNILKIV